MDGEELRDQTEYIPSVHNRGLILPVTEFWTELDTGEIVSIGVINGIGPDC